MDVLVVAVSCSPRQGFNRPNIDVLVVAVSCSLGGYPPCHGIIAVLVLSSGVPSSSWAHCDWCPPRHRLIAGLFSPRWAPPPLVGSFRLVVALLFMGSLRCSSRLSGALLAHYGASLASVGPLLVISSLRCSCRLSGYPPSSWAHCDALLASVGALLVVALVLF